MSRTRLRVADSRLELLAGIVLVTGILEKVAAALAVLVFAGASYAVPRD